MRSIGKRIFVVFAFHTTFIDYRKWLHIHQLTVAPAHLTNKTALWKIFLKPYALCALYGNASIPCRDSSCMPSHRRSIMGKLRQAAVIVILLLMVGSSILTVGCGGEAEGGHQSRARRTTQTRFLFPGRYRRERCRMVPFAHGKS
jgi:hypothetical protein